jgi:hypothetical protein
MQQESPTAEEALPEVKWVLSLMILRAFCLLCFFAVLRWETQEWKRGMGLPLLNSSNAFDVQNEVPQSMQQKLDEVLSVAFLAIKLGVHCLQSLTIF